MSRRSRTSNNRSNSSEIEAFYRDLIGDEPTNHKTQGDTFSETEAFFAELVGETAEPERPRRDRAQPDRAAPPPSAIQLTVVPRSGRREDLTVSPSEQLGGSASTFTVQVGTDLLLEATGSPTPVGTPAYTWTPANSSLVTITPVATAQTHPNRVNVRGLRPGTTSITVTYRAASGGVANTTFSVQVTPIVRIAQPATQTVWVMAHEPEEPDLLTRGIAQGGSLWTSTTGSGNLTVAHGSVANGTGDRTGTPGTRVRVGERGLVVRGQVDASATGVNIQVRDTGGTPIPLKTSPTATAANELAATLAAPASGAATRDFEAVLFFDNPSSRFGPVTVRAESAGLSPNAAATSAVLLAGVQMALVNDTVSNVDGRTAGPVPTEADERVVIDFLASPQANLANLSAQTRARRMIVYTMSHRLRSLGTRTVRRPEMPMWMIELHLIGVNASTLLPFLQQRAGGARRLQLAATFRLRTSWDGPNSASTTRPYSYTQDFNFNTSVNIALNTGGTAIEGLQTSGEVQNALTPAPVSPTFPVTGRRLPQVKVSGVTRRWGRQSAATLLPTLLIEHQPLVVNSAAQEIIRGGDGQLTLTSLTVDGAAVDPGRLPGTTGTSVPPAATPLAGLPTFRIQGANPPAADRRAIIDAVVEEYVTAHAADAWVAALPLAAWQTTVALIVQHESIGGTHFDERSTSRLRFGTERFGHEQDMPTFGAPAGYGWGQLDSPPVTNDAAWSFVENLRAATDLLIGQKARAAHTAMNAHLPSPMTRLAQAAFRREAVRRYNGNTEMSWSGTTWVINPTSAQTAGVGVPNPRLNYPNEVLGTTVVYFTGSGASLTFPWPIAFPPAQFGPGI
ncbi:MAG: hypothetical protein IPK82_40310 [Polyangiaceae bacterium]|nr:hypothetical protein [Polyangiaceae bacterium]